jgi:hypothetical protein
MVTIIKARDLELGLDPHFPSQRFGFQTNEKMSVQSAEDLTLHSHHYPQIGNLFQQTTTPFSEPPLPLSQASVLAFAYPNKYSDNDDA